MSGTCVTLGAPATRAGAARGAGCGARAPAAAARVQARCLRRGRLVCAATPGVIDVTEATFEEEVVKSSVPVLVDFWATWCGPCKLISKEYGSDVLKVVKIETDPNPALVERFGIYGLPTVMLFRDGEMVEGSKREGAITKDKLIAHLATFRIDKPAPAA